MSFVEGADGFVKVAETYVEALMCWFRNTAGRTSWQDRQSFAQKYEKHF